MSRVDRFSETAAVPLSAVCSFFIALKMGLDDMLNSCNTASARTICSARGGIAVFGYIVFYLILYNQRSRALEVEPEIQKMEFRR
jgi:hypothetical protein